MSDTDDPFGLMNDAGRTRIRPAPQRGGVPRPDGREPPGYPPPRAFDAPVVPSVPLRRDRAHPNPLIATFAPVLEIAPELERAGPPESPEALRVRLLDNLMDARDAAIARGVPLARADQAAWLVAALVDDLAINTPWGGHSDWPRQPLVVSLSGEVDAGTRFFERLAELQRNPGRDPEMLELAHVCLALGFRGRFRVEGPQAQAPLLQARTTAARQLRSADAERAPLSPNWEGADAPATPRRFAVPLWTIGLIAVAIVAAIYVTLAIRLQDRGENLYALARLVPPPERAGIVRPPRSTPPGPLSEPVLLELLPQFQAAAPPGTVAALSGREDVSQTLLVVRGAEPEVFRSARADINAAYAPLIAAIGATIVQNADVIGRVTVTGHTDSIPVQATNPFATNQGLSEARAQAIARLLIEAGVPADLLHAEGRADSEPVADNATAAGRAQNRRVEIRVEKRL